MNNSFYVCNEYFLLIHDTKENAAAAVAPVMVGVAATAVPATAAEYWSKTLNSRVTFSTPGEPIFVIKKEDKFWNVIIGEKIGWIFVASWMKIKQLEKNNETQKNQ